MAIVVLAAGELSRPNEPMYHAEVLVVANDLAIRVESLPRTAVAIFNSSSVAELAATISGTGVDPDYLIREIVRAQPVQNTYIIEVDAMHADPELAAVYANAAGEALAQELNRIGAGLGSFALQARADVPDSPIPAGRRQLGLAALIAGTAGALGIGVLYSLRSGSGSAQDERKDPIAPQSPVSVDSTEERDSTTYVTFLDSDEAIDALPRGRTAAVREQLLTFATETAGNRRNRWLTALRDIQDINGAEPSEPSQNPSGTTEAEMASFRDKENVSNDAAPTKGETHRPQMLRHTGSGVPTQRIRSAPDVVVELDGTNPPAT